ncbi:MAG: phosphatidate cytidylyltransferase, partial [Gemmatimonadaceae bacterium]
WPVGAPRAPRLLSGGRGGRGGGGRPIESVATTLFGIWYTGGMLTFAYALRYHRFAIGALAGSLLLFLPMVLTWLTDSGAFFAGKAFGKRKLMPSVSPGKTWAGAIGGLVLSVVGTWAYLTVLLQPYAKLGLTLTGIVILGVVIGVVAQIGDLVESLLKRQAGVKDSSTLIPGHGGVLDRTDSLLFTLPVGYVLLEALLKVGR